MSTTAGINTPQQSGDTLMIPVGAGTTMYAGNLVAVSAAGLAVLAANTAGLKAVGRLERDIVSGRDERGQALAEVRRGCFSYNNSATAPLAQADIGSAALVENEETVAKTASNNVKAGVFLGFDVDGRPLIDTRNAIAG